MFENYAIVQKNAIIQRVRAVDTKSPSLTVMQRRIILLLMSKITPETTVFCALDLAISDFCIEWDIPRGGKLYKDIATAVNDLKTNRYAVDGDVIVWLSPASCVENGKMHLLLDNSLGQYLLNIRSGYTMYTLSTVKRFKSKFSFTLYELLKSYEKQGAYLMRIADAYCRLGDGKHCTPSYLNHHILKDAITEINALSDISIKYKFETAYNKSTHILFSIKSQPKAILPKDNNGSSSLVSAGIKSAKTIDIVDFLQCKHPELITKCKGQYCNPQHKSIKFKGNLYYRFSKDVYGDAIQYLINFGGLSFHDVAVEVAEYSGQSANSVGSAAVTLENEMNAQATYNPPRRCPENTKIIHDYLRRRSIADDIINRLIGEGMIYADSRCNCVFCNNEPGKGVCMVKGTGTVPFNKIIAENPNNYWHFTEGHNPKKIYVFEAPIDAVSFFEWNFRQNGIYVAMGGLKKNTLKKIEEDFNADGTKTIELCVDWDAAGIKFVSETMGGKYPHRLPQDTTGTTDWNDILCAQKKKKRPSVCLDIYCDDDDDCDFIPF